MKTQTKKQRKQKQYTTIRIKTSVAERIKKVAETEGRKIEIVSDRLLNQALDQVPA